MIKQTGRPERILEEASKCDVVCANCHAERTYQGKHFINKPNVFDFFGSQLSLIETSNGPWLSGKPVG